MKEQRFREYEQGAQNWDLTPGSPVVENGQPPFPTLRSVPTSEGGFQRAVSVCQQGTGLWRSAPLEGQVWARPGRARFLEKAALGERDEEEQEKVSEQQLLRQNASSQNKHVGSVVLFT